ncbi:hypothetical protein DB347_22465 [Opitutaceae bacterium EW11]|nr:hypothetical protein DB347_22465 [Opitutaceae bacterium EW11]
MLTSALSLDARSDVRPVSWTSQLLVPGLAVFLAFWGVRGCGLLDNNEAMYAEIAREMARGGDWILPHLNGVLYLEKPPLLYWCVAVSMRLFGDSEWAVRLVPGAFFVATVLGVRAFGRRLGGAAFGERASLILATMLGFVLMHRTLLFDIPLSCFLAYALFSYHDWRQRGRRADLWRFYGFLALAVLSKGLVAIALAGGAVLLTCWMTPENRPKLSSLLDPAGLLVFASLAVPWHVVAWMRHPDFGYYYFVNEHVLRFLDRRVPHDYHTGPLTFYLERVPLYLGLWTVFLPLAFRRSTARSGGIGGDGGARLRATGYLWTWFLLPLVFFSLSRAKANYYLLCGIAPMALLIARGWPAPGETNGARRLALGAASVLALFFAAAVVWESPGLRSRLGLNLSAPTERLLGLVFLAAVALSGVGAWLAFRRRSQGVFVATALLTPLIFAPVPWVLRDQETRLSQRELVDELHGAAPEARVCLFEQFEKFSSVPFYAGSPVEVVDSASNDLLYGRAASAHPELFPDTQRFERASRAEHCWLIVDREDLEKALKLFAPAGYRVYRIWPKTAALANWPARR